MGAEVVGASDLFYVYYSASPSEASEVIVYVMNWQLWGCPSGENLPVSQI